MTSSVVSGRADGRFCAASLRTPRNPAPMRMTIRTRRMALEIKLHADLEQPRIEDAQRHETGGVVVVLTRDRIRVERVVEVEVQCGLRPAELEKLRKTEIELVEPLAVRRARRDDVNRGVGGSARQTSEA